MPYIDDPCTFPSVPTMGMESYLLGGCVPEIRDCVLRITLDYVLIAFACVIRMGGNYDSIIASSIQG